MSYPGDPRPDPKTITRLFLINVLSEIYAHRKDEFSPILLMPPQLRIIIEMLKEVPHTYVEK